MSVQCWPNGHNSRRDECSAVIPDGEYETISRFGWGFVWARDDGAGSGEGPFLACPEHRDDCTEEERDAARARNAVAQNPQPEGETGDHP